MCDSVLMQNDPVGDHAAVPPENMQGCKVVPKQPEMIAAHVHASSMCGGSEGTGVQYYLKKNL